MTEQTRPPQQVLLACLLIGLSSTMVLIELFGTLSNWGSLELQKALAKALEESPVPGLSLDEAMRWMQIALYAAVPLSVAGIVLSIFTARRDGASRIALTGLCIVAAIAFLAAGLFGLLPAILALVCASMLWSTPARDWFAGRVSAPAAAGAEIAQETLPTGVTDPVPPGATPREVVTAGVLGLVGSIVVGGMLFSNAAAVALRRLAPAEYERSFGDTPLLAESLFGIESTAQNDTIVVVVCVVLSVVAGLGTVVAIALLSGRVWARRPMLWLSLLAIPLSALVFPVGIVITVMATVGAMLLNRPAARRWR